MKKFITREIYKKVTDRYVGKEIIKVLIGQRRVGKSYLLFQIMDSIRKQFPNPNMIYINLETNEFERINSSGTLYDYVKSKSKADELNFLMIDEIQVVPEFEKTLRSLLSEGGMIFTVQEAMPTFYPGNWGLFWEEGTSRYLFMP